MAGCRGLCNAPAWQTASSDKALIQKIPPSFAENPNEDLKCPAGRRPGGCGYTLPLLALPVIVSLSPHWPGLAGDERDTTAWWAYVHRHHACIAPLEARFHSLPQTTGVTSRLRKKDKTNTSCWQKIEEIMGKGTPVHAYFTLQCKVNLTQKENKKTSVNKTFIGKTRKWFSSFEV